MVQVIRFHKNINIKKNIQSSLLQLSITAPTETQGVTMSVCQRKLLIVIFLAQIKYAAGNGMSSDSFSVMPKNI